MIKIEAAYLSAASYVTANLRPHDHQELFCQLPEGTRSEEPAYALLHSGDAFIATLRGNPVAFFGTSPINVATISVWALGTRYFLHAVPAITRFLVEEHLPKRIEEGFLAMEARPMVGNTRALDWIVALRGQQYGPPYVYGRGGELFYLFRWTVGQYRVIRESYRSK